MKCKHCSNTIEIKEDNFYISNFNIIINCEHCFSEVTEDEFNYNQLKKVYWNED